MIRIDHLIYNDYLCNLFLHDLVIDFDDQPGVDREARDSDQFKFPDCFTHAMVNVRSCGFPRIVLQADAIVVRCGLANFEQSSWSTHRRHELWGRTKNCTRRRTTTSLFAVPRTTILECAMVVQYGQLTAESSVIPKHIGRNPKIIKSILESENYHTLHSRLSDGMHWFFSSRNILIMIYRNGRHRSVANAELWSHTLTHCGRYQYSVSLLHLSELDFWEDTCAGNCSECSKTVSQLFFQAHYDRVQAECSRRVPVPDPMTGLWKRPRTEHTDGSAQHAKDSLR